MTRRFQDLPLGTRFRYLGPKSLVDSIWVVLERHGCGLIAKWEGVDGPVAGQSICSFAETEAECQTLRVAVVEIDA